MAIELGLSRISKLLAYFGNPQNRFNVLHVAGTNGKGSVCSILQSVLQTNSVYQVGKFTSPHLIHITDCISINGRPITTNDFHGIKEQIREANEHYQFGCTEFELLTCTAFRYFQLKECNWCVLEVGLGGRLDATNSCSGPGKICGITKVGMDHQNLLGDTLGKISFEKAGIIVPGVEFVAVDGTNDTKVLDVIRQQIALVGASSAFSDPQLANDAIKTFSWGSIDRKMVPLNGDYQASNLAVALSMLDYLQRKCKISISKDQLKHGLKNVRWPGRLQDAVYSTAIGHKQLKLLIDGAHNGDAAVALARHIEQRIRGDESQPVTFVIAVTKGKTLDSLLGPLIKRQDRVVVTEFGPVEGMPWISAMKPSDLIPELRKYTENVSEQRDVCAALNDLSADSTSPIIVCGSLYLCGELLRLDNVT
ncbi:LADA_0G09824g1_1 [Lachancea dasiensis]|uniref:Dihydrofolate synthetase n=1 Tax=Lachancea dasiensis TaxID=1072105 RepID=A0A1G4JUT5_9SACH|nr:LADA_0G09824g1_1 [Lachancea dasiensis]